MPLSRERLRQRGFNQALELARQLAPAKTDSHAAAAPARHAGAKHSCRGKNDCAMCAVLSASRPGVAKDLAGRRVLLVDDVMTSGATLFAAAQLLRAAGAAHITGLVLARTE